MASIKISTDIKCYDVQNERGEIIGQIKFNPSDVNLINRVEKFEETINAIHTEINNTLSNNADENTIKSMLIKADETIKDSVDNMFGKGTSLTIFGNQNIFNELNGKTFLERFLESIIPVIKQDIEDSTSHRADKLNKYLDTLNEVNE